MKKLLLLLVICLLSSFVNLKAQLAPPQNTDYIKQAKEFVGMLRDSNFTKAYNTFDNTMKQAMDETKLRELWQSIILQFGDFKKFGNDAKVSRYQQYEIVILPVEFEKSSVNFRIPYNSQGLISGLFLIPKESNVKYNPPDYVKQNEFTEKDVKVGKGEWVLNGTLTMPKGKGPFPALVLVHGSGPNDRDETLGPNKPFKDLAWGLASKGIAVLRYEKRTKQYAEKLLSMINKLTVKEETIDDAVNAAELLRREQGINPEKVFVLGHSLGGMMAPRIEVTDPKIAGIILMAGAARPLEDVYLDQITYFATLDGKESDEEKEQLDNIKRQIARVKDPNLNENTPADSLPMGIAPAYWLDLRKYNPVKTAETIKKPILVLQGGRDYQVTMEDYNLWKSALEHKSNVQFKLYAPLNHLFLAGEGLSTPSEYNTESHIPEYVIKDISDWLKTH